MARKVRQKQHSRVRNEVESIERMLFNNARAVEEGPRRKKWSLHDLKPITPLTDNQELLFHLFYQGQNICAHGSAGTGKTFLALYLAFGEVLAGKQKQIIIVRSAVSTRDLGHMPGGLDEKVHFYEAPYQDICTELFGRSSTYDDMKVAGKIKFMPTTFIRGLTWDNAIVIVDEGQNMTEHEINSIMTRVGLNTRIIFAGDLPQTDLRRSSQDTSGMKRAISIMERMTEFDCVHFTTDDIVRSDFVKSWIISSEKVD